MFKMRMKNVVAAAFVLVVTAISGAAQDPNRSDSRTTAPDAKAILKQVAETYKNLRSYHFEGKYTTERVVESMGLKNETKIEELFVNAAIKPDRSRIESKNLNFSVTSVSDGETKWIYAPGINEYTKTEGGAANPVTGRSAVDPMAYLASATNAVARFSSVADWVMRAKIIGEEKLEIEGRQVDCLVIEPYYTAASAARQPSDLTRKLWIDKSRNIVLREIQHTNGKMPGAGTVTWKTTYIFTVAKLGEQVPKTLFTFIPPEGAKEVAELNPSSRPAAPTPAPPRPAAPRSPAPRPAAPTPSGLVGKDATAFALKDLDENQVDLQSLKGKVVLLDFWASWCGPCVAELPHIEKLHKDFKDRGLVTLGVNNEEVEVARAFVKKKGYTFTTLVDEGREVSMKYGVSGIPQVFIIDRQGKVKWHARGYGPGREVELRGAVEKALNGVNPPAPVSTRGGAPVSPEEKVLKGVDPPAPSDGGGGMSITPASKMVRFSSGVLSGHATKKALPQYPIKAKKARAQGTVQVEITVSESGKVIEAKAISGHELLRDAAVKAAKQWEFKPAEVSGAPVKTQGILTFVFTMQ